MRRFSFFIKQLDGFLNLSDWSKLPVLQLESLAMKYRPVLICAFSFFVATPSSAEVWLCKRGDLEEYTNVGNTKNCRKLDLPGITTVPAAKVSVGAARPARTAGGTTTATRPAEFPKVDGTVQRARDDDRRKLLEEELKEQEARLAELRKAPNASLSEQQTQISRAEANIASLKRELSRIND